MSGQETPSLNGKRIVVVEDDFLLATDICRELRDLGATVLGPAPTPFYAAQLIGQRRVDAAVLDVRLHGTTVFSVADLLRERGVPIIFATACDRKAIPSRFRDACLLEKPLDRKRLVEEIVALTKRVSIALTKVAPPAAALSKQTNQQSFARALARTFVRK